MGDGRGLPWALAAGHYAQVTVYRLRHRCPTARTAARPIPEGMTIFCLVTFTTGAVRSAMPATVGFLVKSLFRPLFHLRLSTISRFISLVMLRIWFVFNDNRAHIELDYSLLC